MKDAVNTNFPKRLPVSKKRHEAIKHAARRDNSTIHQTADAMLKQAIETDLQAHRDLLKSGGKMPKPQPKRSKQ